MKPDYMMPWDVEAPIPARDLFDAAMREDEEIRNGSRTPIERLRHALELSPGEALTVDCHVFPE